MLEEVIKENTLAIRELIATIAKGVPTPAAQVAAVAAEAPKGQKAKATVATNGASSTQVGASPAAPADATAQKTAPAAAPTADGAASVTYEDVKAAILKLSQAKGREQVVAALTAFGVAKGPELKPEQFAGFIAKANELVAA